jgi:2'-5' RNA ligase
MRSLVQIEVMESESKPTSLYLIIQLPEAVHLLLLQAVKQILPEMEADIYPAHCTIFHMGKEVWGEKTEGIIAAIQASLDMLEQEYTGERSLWFQQLGFFEPSPSSDGRSPILCKLQSEYLQQLNAVCARAMMPHSDQQQFLWYKPHMTLGYLNRSVSKAEEQALKQVPVGMFLSQWQTQVNLVLMEGGAEEKGRWLLRME